KKKYGHCDTFFTKLENESGRGSARGIAEGWVTIATLTAFYPLFSRGRDWACPPRSRRIGEAQEGEAVGSHHLRKEFRKIGEYTTILMKKLPTSASILTYPLCSR